MECDRIVELYEKGIYDQIKQMDYCFRWHRPFLDFTTGEILMDEDMAQGLYNSFWGTKDYNDAYKLIHSNNSRYNRLLKRITRMLNCATCGFFTLTWSDDVMSKTTEESRRKYVRRFLKSHFDVYIANIDFGKQTNREHYHGICYGEDLQDIRKWPYGFSKVQIITDDPDSCKRISHYVLKLANHFVKSTTRRNYVIYSREKLIKSTISEDDLKPYKRFEIYSDKKYKDPGNRKDHKTVYKKGRIKK